MKQPESSEVRTGVRKRLGKPRLLISAIVTIAGIAGAISSGCSKVIYYTYDRHTTPAIYMKSHKECRHLRSKDIKDSKFQICLVNKIENEENK